MTGANNSNGLTLLELIAVLVIFSLVALGMVALTPTIQQMGQHSDQPEEWLHEARSCAEELISLGSVDDCEDNWLTNELDKLNNCDQDSIEYTPNDDYCQLEITGGQDYETIVIRLPQN